MSCAGLLRAIFRAWIEVSRLASFQWSDFERPAGFERSAWRASKPVI
jgi:hypothetical protein